MNYLFHKSNGAMLAFKILGRILKTKIKGGNMGKLEEMLLRNGLIYRSPDGSSSYIEGSLLSNTLVVRDSSGRTTHRIERAANGVDLVAINTSTNTVDMRIAA